MSARLDTDTATRATLAAGRRRPVFPRRFWTAEEDAFLRKHYARRGSLWCAASLPGRTGSATRQRAGTLGLHAIEPWTRAERDLLRREWGEVGDRTLRKMLPGRTQCAIAQQAQQMGLGDPTQGRRSVKEAMARTGLGREQLLRVLAEEGVRVAHRPRAWPAKAQRVGRPRAGSRGRSRSGFRWLVVDLDDAVEAVDRWLKRQSVRLTGPEAADRCGVDKTTMRWALQLLATTRPVEGMPARKRWSLSVADVDDAIALYRERKAEERAARIAAGGRR